MSRPTGVFVDGLFFCGRPDVKIQFLGKLASLLT